MVQTKLFYLDKKKREHSNHKTSFIKNGKSKHWTADKELQDSHERFIKYIDLDFNKKDVPITDDEIRKHIKKSFRNKADLIFIEEYASDSSYDNLINDVYDSKEYQKSIESKQTSIKIQKKTKTQERKGIKVSKNYYYVIVKPRKNKDGTKVSAQRRFYSIKTGKQVKTKNVTKYISEVTPNKKQEEVVLTKSKYKKQTPLRRIRRKEERSQRMKRLRGRR